MSKKLIGWPLALALLLLALVGVTVAGPAQAQTQPARFHMARVDVIDAKDLLNERGAISLPYGAALQLTISGAPLAQDFAGKPMEVRIYRRNDDDSGPSSLNLINPCIVYYGAVYPLFPEGGVVTIANLNDIHWLNIDAAGHLKPGRFLLVFQTRTDDHDLFRLGLKNGLSQGRYFNLGIKLVVGTAYFRPADIAAYAAEYRSTQAGEMQDAKANTPALNCYRARQKTDDARGKITFLEACATGPKANPGLGGDARG